MNGFCAYYNSLIFIHLVCRCIFGTVTESSTVSLLQRRRQLDLGVPLNKRIAHSAIHTILSMEKGPFYTTIMWYETRCKRISLSEIECNYIEILTSRDFIFIHTVLLPNSFLFSFLWKYCLYIFFVVVDEPYYPYLPFFREISPF